MTAEEYFGGWYKFLEKNLLDEIVTRLNTLYTKEKVYPDFKSIFKAFNLCDYQKASIVFIGQDPYSDGNATGLAFANEGDRKKYSSSLEVLIDALLKSHSLNDLNNFDPTLESWAKQGVLLLNSSLTVEAGKPMSHTLIWRPLIGKFLKNLSTCNSGLIYVLLGEQAQSFRCYINPNDTIIEVPHPSYFARKKGKMPDIFSMIDVYTIKKNNTKIKWL